MLVRLFAENFGAFRDGFDLSLEALDLGTDQDRGYFNVPLRDEDQPLKLLRLAAIYGPNGSGKSTVIDAVSLLWDLVAQSGPKFQQGDPIHGYHPFRLDRSSATSPCVLGCEVVVEGRIIEYRIAFDSERIIEEVAIERGSRKDVELFSRDQTGRVTLHSELLYEQTSIDLSKVTRSNASVISVAAQLNQPGFQAMFEALNSSLTSLSHGGPIDPSMRYSLKRLEEDQGFRNWALRHILMPADIGITGVRVEERAVPSEIKERLTKMFDGMNIENNPRQLEAVFSHSGVDTDYELEMQNQSQGTRKMLSLTGPWYDIVHHGLTAFVDELSASLHPTLLGALLTALNSEPSQPASQLIFTVHDPTPLEEALRRDQVFFTEKDNSGIARLTALSEFKPRQNTNIRKQYLEGRFGGIPRYPNFSTLYDGVGDGKET